MIDDARERIGRRGFLGVAGAGALGLAGYIGGDEPAPVGEGGNGGDAAELWMRTATSTTAAYAANQGLAVTVNENTDSVFLTLANAGTASRLPIPTRNQP